MKEERYNPWREFLHWRKELIHYMHDINGYSDKKISDAVSTDEEQIYLIRKDTEPGKKY
jgi:hypothetical protein